MTTDERRIARNPEQNRDRPTLQFAEQTGCEKNNNSGSVTSMAWNKRTVEWKFI
jgi:hypothetical protein